MLSQEKKKKRIAILTGGGDCPGLNAVIRAVAITAEVQYNTETIGLKDGFEGIYSENYEVLSGHAISDIIQIGGTILGTTNMGHFCLPLPAEVLKRTIENYKKMDIGCVVCIGGDGTMSIAHALSLAGMKVVGVPKTIDNDLCSTDQTFGFDSAVSVATEAIDRIHTTAASHHRVMVVEVMGRNAGWIALHAGVASGAAVILLPEIDWEWDHVIEKIKQRVETHRAHYAIVVVAEGVALPEGVQVSIDEGRRDHRVRLGGVGLLIAEMIREKSGYETRCTVLGHLQRGGSPTCYDRILATKFGSMAAKLACEGDYGKMVALKGTRIETVLITGEMQKQRVIEPDTDQLIWSAKAIGVGFGTKN